jgi:hypothetical protein
MSKLSDYTEENLKQRYRQANNQYKPGSLSITSNHGMVTVTFETENHSDAGMKGVFGGMAAGAAAGAAIGSVVPGIGTLLGGLKGALVGLFVGAAVAGQMPEVSRHTQYFDTDTGEHLGSTKVDAIKESLKRASKKFANLDFSGARKQFNGAYQNSPANSHEERMAKVNMQMIDATVEGVRLMDGGNYREGRRTLNSAFSLSNEGDTGLAIVHKMNEYADGIGQKALGFFRQRDWLQAEQFFEQAYMTSADDAKSEEFRSGARIAARMTISTTTQALADLHGMAKNSEIRKFLADKLVQR